MQSYQGSFDYPKLVKQLEGKVFRRTFIKSMVGIYSASMTLKSFEYGAPIASSNIYRKFVYNKFGQVVQKYYFDDNGALEMKEKYSFDNKGKILHSEFIKSNSFLEEKFENNEDGNVHIYQLINPIWKTEGKHNKREVYSFDKQRRKVKKISYGFLGSVELITHYLYEGDSEKYSFRHVTDPDGELILTLLYTYDSKFNQTGLYSFFLTPSAVKDLLNKQKDWKSESLSASNWEYDAKGNAIGFVSDIAEQLFHYKFQNADMGVPRGGRVVTQQSKSEFELINGKYYLVKTTEYWPKFDEPKELKEYTYFDKSGKQIYPPPSK
ncbi:MAG: hypothetical protein GC192_22120 [Bacteroidetes bacterium]|nr:hypothetical protein [Bacteroidota bacterium]